MSEAELDGLSEGTAPAAGVGPVPARRGPDGILVVAKPAGPTSHDIVGLVRRLSGSHRVGHGGTLDPFASGVLPVFLGLATRVVEYHMGDDKAYRATVCFGFRSTTDDREGELSPGGGPAPARPAVEEALAAFRGTIRQRPPAFSALKIGGRRAYELARRGHAPELAEREVVVRRLELVDWDDSDPERPVAVLEIECGAGTYVRSLARDLGERLGCGAYLGALVRLKSGPFALAAAHDPEDIRRAAAEGPEALGRLLLPVDAGLDKLPAVSLTDEELLAVARGQQIKPLARPAAPAGTTLRLLDRHSALVGVGGWRGGRIVPEKMFVTASGSPAGTSAAAPAPRPRGAGAEPRLQYARAGAPHEVVPGLDALRPDMGRLYVAVGVFDGLHRGHTYLLRELRHAAERAGARPAVITFDAHPEEVVSGLAPALLCDPDERLVRLAAAGVEITVVQHFDHALRMSSYRDFVERIRAKVDLAGFVMTPDAAFGHNREGTPETLTELGKEDGFEVTVVQQMLLDGEQVRSSEIRKRIADGELGTARRMLGRPLAVTGRLVEDGVARVEFDLPVVLPPDGRYGVLLGPAWNPAKPPVRATIAAVATIRERQLELDKAAGPFKHGIRVVFDSRLED